MTRQQRWFWMAIFLVGALVLTPILWLLLQEAVLKPLVLLFWWVGRNIQRAPQSVYWTAAVLLLAMITLTALLRDMRVAPEKKEDFGRQMGPLETLAREIQRMEHGHYFYWVIAYRLARLARQMLSQRNGPTPLPPRSLEGPGWQPPANVQAFLEVGMQRSHEIQGKRLFFWQRWQPAINVKLDQVIAYLENQQENESE